MKKTMLLFCFLVSTHATFTFDTQRRFIAINRKNSCANDETLLKKYSELIEKNSEQSGTIEDKADLIETLYQIIISNKESAEIRDMWLRQNLDHLTTAYEHNEQLRQYNDLLCIAHNSIAFKLHSLTKENTQLKNVNAILSRENHYHKSRKTCPYTLSCTIL